MEKTFELDDVSVAALMMCFQKAMMEELDIRDLFKELRFVEADGKLVTISPPVLTMTEEEPDDALETEKAREIVKQIDLRD